MIDIHATMQIEHITLNDDTMNKMVKFMDGAHTEFTKAAIKVHRKIVFSILIYLIRICPVLTGRLRGSWTPFLDKYQKQAFYGRYLNDASLVRSKPKTLLGHASQSLKGFLGLSAVDQGKKDGYFADGPLITTVGSNVVYAAKVNDASHYLDVTVAMSEPFIDQTFKDFIEASEKAGWIPTDLGDDPVTEKGL